MDTFLGGIFINPYRNYNGTSHSIQDLICRNSPQRHSYSIGGKMCKHARRFNNDKSKTEKAKRDKMSITS